ncbi:MAG TPA: hypothetical protein VK348_07065, partial [Planctomycetota bacterium]|nr:hypothetical protein [Planctomycetota bacterium]
RNYNVDRSRVVLDFGKGSTLFGLRLATHFPDRFAGLIVRWPVDANGLRLGSLNGIPVLLIQSADTKDDCDKLKKKLDVASPGSCTVIEATGYPFKAATPEIEKWMASVKRDLNRKRVVLEPNDDRYKQGYWASIGAMDALSTLAQDQRPRFEVEADRKTNRIVVKARGIEGFALYLNDSLVDLDKEYVIEVNGKAFTEKRSRSRSTMLELLVKKLDANYLYPASTQMLVPKSEASKGDAAPASGEPKR